MKKTPYIIILLSSLFVMSAFPADRDVIENGQFEPAPDGTFPGWEKLRDTTRLEAPLEEFKGAPEKMLYIENAGGVSQMLKSLPETQTYRLRFRAWRRGNDWGPSPSISIGEIPITYERKLLSPASNGARDELLTIDTLVRPGAGESPLKIAVIGDIPQLGIYSRVWVESVSMVPVAQSTDLLPYPLEGIPFWDRSILRAGDEERVGLQLHNLLDKEISAKVRLIVPDGMQIVGSPEQTASDWKRRTIYCWFLTAYEVPRSVPEKHPSSTLSWTVKATRPGTYNVQFEANGTRVKAMSLELAGTFDPPLAPVKTVGEIPKPVPADTGDIKVGANFYPGWVPGTGWGWSVLDPYPNRKPALGYYDDSNPEVIDWQIKWALEHGISFFNVCWFRERGNEGKPVQAWRSDTLENGLLKAKFLSQFQFVLTWENQNAAGVSSKEDMLENLLPFWIENYFKHPSYLTFDGQPVLFIYSMANFAAQVGGIEHLPELLEAMRERCREAGLKGLIVAGEYRGLQPGPMEELKATGLDASWSYGLEEPEHARLRQEWAILPDIATISVGWDPRPWQDYMGYWWTQNWNRTPEEFQEAAAQTKAIVDSYPIGNIGRHIVQLDNWNEWGEGHWLAPSRHVGFGYLEAIRRVFAPESTQPINLIPEDVDLGPYDEPYHRWIENQRKALGEVP